MKSQGISSIRKALKVIMHKQNIEATVYVQHVIMDQWKCQDAQYEPMKLHAHSKLVHIFALNTQTKQCILVVGRHYFEL